MPHIVYAGQRIAITASQLVDVKDGLREAAADGAPFETYLAGSDGAGVWLLWTPGAPILVSDADVPPLPEIPWPDLSALGLGLPPEPPQQQRRVGF
jgi:hypothetical protein